MKKEKIAAVVVVILLLGYMGLFAYMNLNQYGQHVDSDIAAEALLARAIWEDKTLTPDDWIASTERLVVGMPTLAAVFYGMSGSMQLAVGIACIIIGAALTGVIYWVLRKQQISALGAVTALLVLYAIPTNGFRNEGQMVPFVTLLFFLFADYYALHSILLFLTAAFYLHMKKKGCGRPEMVMWAAMFVFTLALSLGGQRCLQVVILPLIIVECISIFCESGRFSVKLPGKRLCATAYAGTLVVAFLLSCVYQGQADYVVYLLKPQEVVQKLLHQVTAAVLEGFGIAGDCRVGSLESVMQLLVWAFIALVVYGIIYIYRKGNGIARQKKEFLGILLACLGVTSIIISITSAEAAHYYFFSQWFVAMVVVAILIDDLRQKKSAFWGVILAAVCLFAVLNIGYTYIDAAATDDNLKEYEEVAEYLLEEGIEYGYGEFWDAERICLITDGKVTMGHSYRMDQLGMYWWLTDRRWYPPALPEQMRTAYVVRTGMREGFEKQFADPEAVTLGFENESFAVYISETNYVKAQ